MSPDGIPAELKTILDRAAGKEHSAEGPVMACLAEILTAHEAMLRAQFAEEIRTRGGIAAIWPLIEQRVRAQIVEQIRTLAATGAYNADEYGSHRNILELADDLARGDQ